MSVSGVIGNTGVMRGGSGSGDIFYLAMETGDLVLKETGDKIIVVGSTGIQFLLLESDDFLLQENGSKVIYSD